MPTVPNWIARAVIVNPNRRTIEPITEWRATKTQVIVRTSPTGPEHRFYLETLAAVGQPSHFRSLRTRLEAPDAEDVIEMRRAEVIENARRRVMVTVDRQRLQDSHQSAADVARKLIEIKDAIDAELAKLAEVL